MRKIVQIATTQDASDDPVLSVVALCDDGSVWRTSLVYEWKAWQRLPAIPQTPAPRRKVVT